MINLYIYLQSKRPQILFRTYTPEEHEPQTKSHFYVSTLDLILKYLTPSILYYKLQFLYFRNIDYSLRLRSLNLPVAKKPFFLCLSEAGK